MLDPQTYILLHKYQRRDRLRQAEQDRLVDLISQPSTLLPSIQEFSRLISDWWTRRRQTRKETHLVEGKIVMP